MKKVLIIIPLVLIVFVSFGQKQNSKLKVPKNPKQITSLDSKINLYKAGDFYISGQPSDSMFLALKEKGLDVVINVRTPEEIKELKEGGFDEEVFLDSLGIKYVNLPIGGKAGYSKEVIENINSALTSSKGPAMIHCRSAGRASNAWVAWLINYGRVPVDEAITLGKQVELKFYLEDLLGYDLYYDKKK